jgi:hypothetical protein
MPRVLNAPCVQTFATYDEFEAALQAALGARVPLEVGQPPIGLLVGAAGTGKTELVVSLLEQGAPLVHLSPCADSGHRLSLDGVAIRQGDMLVIDDIEGWNGGSLREGLKALQQRMAEGHGPAGLLLVARDARALKCYQDVLPPSIPALLLEGRLALGAFSAELHDL